MSDTYYDKRGCRFLKETMTSERFNTIKKVGCVHHPDTKAWMMRDVVADKHYKNIRSRPVFSPEVPTSAELTQMANKEWCNREERKGHSEAHRTFWCSGWISGFLTPNKPDWSKEHDTAIRNATIDEAISAVGSTIINDVVDARDAIESLRTKEQP